MFAWLYVLVFQNHMYTGLNTLAFWKSSQSFLENCLLGYKILSSVQFSSVRLLSHAQLFVTPWIATCQTSLSITNSQSYSNSCPLSWWCYPTIILCHPFLFLTSVFPSIKVFTNESVLCTMWPKHSSFRFSISPHNEHSGLISFRTDWLDLLAVQGTLKSFLQHHSSKESIYSTQLSL